jgi:hypothetical protein
VNPCRESATTGTFARQIEILCTQTDSELVYFAEDDYFYLPDRLVELVGLMRENQEIDFVSPYDHLDYYTLAFHQHPVKVHATAQRHWRQANSTCMTFMTRRQVLQKTRPLFMSYINGNYDVSIWMALTKMRAFDFMFFLHCGLTDRLLRTAYAKAWWYGWRQLLCGRRYQLWTTLPSIAPPTWRAPPSLRSSTGRQKSANCRGKSKRIAIEMKVLQFDTSGRGGIAHFIFFLSKSLAQRGIDIELLTTGENEMIGEMDFTVHPVLKPHYRIKSFYGKGFVYLHTLWRLAKTIRTRRPDIRSLARD